MSDEFSTPVPLVVDLDDTLIKTDLLHEAFFNTAVSGPSHYIKLCRTLSKGKAAVKAYLADKSHIDYARLPYNTEVVELIRCARTAGRKVYLATASDRAHAEGVVAHLGLFDGLFSSEDGLNLSGPAKAKKLVAEFGEGNFDYVGDGDADRAVWARARHAYTVGLSKALRETLTIPAHHLERPSPSLRVWLKALRVHQYAKNALVFVPVLTAHTFNLPALTDSLLTFIAFSLCASSVYILNDLIDLDADRQHITKHKRPFASGDLPILHGVIVGLVFFLAAFLIASLAPPLMAATLALYFVVTLAYSVDLKRRMLIDVVVLAGLYTLRVIAGAAAIGVRPSEWLLAFSMFVFLFLALIKRYVELTGRLDKALDDPKNRAYRLTDIPVIASLAAASGLNAVTVFALYLSSLDVVQLYTHPKTLWLICPLLIYWIARILLLAHRRTIDDDPVLFAVKDRVSYMTVASMVIIILFAI